MKIAKSILLIVMQALLLCSCGKDTSAKYYTVTWKNYNGAQLEVDEKVIEGTMPEYNGKTPYRSPSSTYNYVFDGWSPDLSPVKANITYTAKFIEQLKPKEIVFTNEDKATVYTMDDISKAYYKTLDDPATENDEVAEYLYKNKNKNACSINPINFAWTTSGDITQPLTLTIANDEEMKDVVRTIDSLTYKNTTVYNLAPGKYYYQLADSSTNTVKSKIQSITLADPVRTIYGGGNVVNMRDIGGYKTASGKTVKYGYIYRSANFESANKLFDTIATEQLKLKTELDVRFDKTTSQHPISGVEYINLGLTDDYTSMLTNSATIANIKTIFENVLTNSAKLPMDFHCTNGADRTGYLGLLIEGALGVSDDDIFKDYELTTFYRYYIPRSDIEITGNVYKFRADGYRESTYGNGSFLKNINTLKQTYGSAGCSISEAVVGFLTQKCKISTTTINALKDLLLS